MYVVDGSGRAISNVAHVVGVNSEREAIEAALAERLLAELP